MKTYLEKIIQHPLVALYGVLLGIIAFSTAIPMCVSSLYDVAFVDIAMAIIDNAVSIRISSIILPQRGCYVLLDRFRHSCLPGRGWSDFRSYRMHRRRWF